MVDYKKRAERRREYYEKIVSIQPLIWAERFLEGGSLVVLSEGRLGSRSRREPTFLRRIFIHFLIIVIGKNRRHSVCYSIPCCLVWLHSTERVLAGRRKVFVTLTAV